VHNFFAGTALEGQATLHSGSVAIATQEGRIDYINVVNITSSVNGDTIRTKLVIYQHSNTNTCTHQKPHVSPRECVKKGQILVDSATMVGGELPWEKTF
jgi:DNA-directed RNA polymerase subunit beta